MSIKSLFQFSFALLLLTSSSAFCEEIAITVTNKSPVDIYVSAKNWEDPNDNIRATPEVIPAGYKNLKETFSNVKLIGDYFEVFFGTVPGDQSCTFAYEFSHGLSVAECSDFSYTLSANGKNISINSINSSHLSSVNH